jgi:hypothetical protein
MTKTNTKTIVLSGTVINVAPLAVSRPNDQFNRNDKVSRLPRAGAKRPDTPAYFPGSTLGGVLRRACRDIAREATIEATGNEKPFSLDVHYMLTQGVDTTNKVKSEKIDGFIHQERGLRDANPLLSLFGRWKLPGHLSIGDMIPQGSVDDTVFIHGGGARTDDFARDPGQAAFLTPEDTERLRDILVEDVLSQKDVAAIKEQRKELVKQRIKATVDEKKRIDEQINVMDEEIAQVKSAKAGSEESIQRPLDGYEAFVPGTEMSHKMVLGNSTDVEIGLFLETLARVSESPFIGAHTRHGCGVIRAEWDVLTRKPGAMRADVIGKVSFSFGEFSIEDFSEEKVLEKALERWHEVKSDLTDNEIDFTRFLITE